MSIQPVETAPEATTTIVSAERVEARAIGSRPMWLLWPSVLLLVVIIGIPLLIAIYISFLNLDQYTLKSWIQAPWVGLANYVTALTAGNVIGASALTSLGVSVGFSLLTTLFITPIGILAALTVNTQYRGRTFVRSLYLVPYVIPTFVTALVWRQMFLNGTGLVDRFLAGIHVANINTYWLLGPNSFWAMVIADVWASWAFIYIMVLAGLQSISHDHYEAADIDGASSWQKLTRVVLPQLRHILGLALLLSTLYHFNNFTLPFVLFGTPPPAQADVLPLNIYVSSFQLFNFGLGGAMAVITLIIMLIPGFMAVGAAYITTRFNFRGRRPYLYSLIGLQTVPQVMLLLPLFVLFASTQAALHLRIVGTYPAVVITFLTFALPFATWLMVSYLGSIPMDLEEAALCDGATRLQALWRVIVPLALPGMVVALVFAFLTGWNDVLFASVLTSPETRTLAVQLQAFSSAQEGGALPLYGQLMGAAVVSAVPVVILYMVFQRYLIGGLTAGGVKG